MGRMKRMWNNLSIQKTLVIYTIGFMLLATMLSSISLNGLYEWKKTINGKYDSFEESDFTDAKGRTVKLSLGSGIDEDEVSPKDKILLKGIALSNTLTIPLIFGGS